MSTDTCRRIQVARPRYLWTVSRRLFLHLCYGRLVYLCIQQQTGDKLHGDSVIADTRYMSTATSGYKWTQFVSGNMSWCKRGLRLTALCNTSLQPIAATVRFYVFPCTVTFTFKEASSHIEGWLLIATGGLLPESFCHKSFCPWWLKCPSLRNKRLFRLC